MSFSVRYYSFNEKRADELWKGFPDDLAKVRAGRKIESGPWEPLEALRYEDVIGDKNEVLHNLKYLDLYYGSVFVNPTPKSGKEEYYVHKALTEATNLKHEPETQPKEDWIKIYSQIDSELIEKAVTIMMRDAGWEGAECRKIVFEFLQNVRPIVKDLKENEDSVYVLEWEGDSITPRAVDELLTKRATNHLKDFYHLIGMK